MAFDILSENPTPTPADPIQAAGETIEELREALKDGNPERLAAAARRVLVLIDTPRNVPALVAWLSWACAPLWRAGWK